MSYELAHVPLSLSIVGNTLHDPHRQYQEQPDHFILGLRGCGCERGSSFPPALVSKSSSTEHIPRSVCRCGCLLIVP